MKKIVTLVSTLLIVGMQMVVLAQPEKKVEKKTEEIIIKQNGDKDLNLKVEINGDKITVNGKPLAEFKDENVSINKRKMLITDGSKSMTFNFGNGQDMMQQFMEDGDEGDNKDKPFLGVVTESKNDGENNKSVKGALVTSITKESAAEKAGLKIGDVITMINDKPVEDPTSLSEAVCWYKPNEEVTVKYVRDGKEKKTKATLGKRKISKKRSFTFNGDNGEGARIFAMPNMDNIELEGRLKDLDHRLNGLNNDFAPFNNFEGNVEGNFNIENMFPRQKKLGLKIQDTEDGGNVKIIAIEDSSAAAAAGLQKEDLIVEIDGKKIDNTDQAREQLVPEEGKKLYKMKILRNKQEMNIDVKIPRKLKTANL
jgi:serine protease Do